MSEWYIVYNGQQVGPMSKEQLVNYGLNPQSKVWREGMAEWVDAYTVPELMGIMPAGASVAQSSSSTKPVYTGSGKSNIVAGIFAIVLGSLGLQYFYCGKIGGGIVFLLLYWCTCGIWGILSLVQGIMMLTMSQEDFDRKYVYSNSFMPLF